MVSQKQYKNSEAYRNSIGTWHRNVFLGREKKTDALESRKAELKKFLTKSGVVRKNLSKSEVNELSEIIKTYKNRVGVVRKNVKKHIKISIRKRSKLYHSTRLLEIILHERVKKWQSVHLLFLTL